MSTLLCLPEVGSAHDGTRDTDGALGEAFTTTTTSNEEKKDDAYDATLDTADAVDNANIFSAAKAKELAAMDAELAAMDAEIAAKDAEIAAKDAEIARLKAEIDEVKAQKRARVD